MSDGEAHERNAILCLVILYSVAFGTLFAGYTLAATGLALGALLGLFIDPDLDHRMTTRAEYRVYRIWKPLGTIFHMYWQPYALFGHRSVFTHGGPGLRGVLLMCLVATPIRILYGLGPLCLLVYKLFPNLNYAFLRSELLASFYTAWAIQDIVHWMRDYG